ncbi:MAG: hypothetical protein Q9183_001361 [Haloplaca sp. 2 TL-2023]
MPVNGMANSDSNPTNAAMTNSSKQQMKTNPAYKAGDGSRKLPSTSNDNSQRKPVTQKAWQSGMNPITQRSTTPASQNGNISQSKMAAQKPALGMDIGHADKHAHDRLLFLLTHFLGLQAFITVKNGDTFSGIFYGSSLEGSESGYLLKMVQKVRSSEANGIHENHGEYIGSGEDHAMSFELKDVVHLAVDGVNFDVHGKAPNGVVAGFRTDADISGNLAVRERNLQRWEPTDDVGMDMSLEGPEGAWDQFQANEQRFGLTSDYDENFYTTPIDRSHPDHRRRDAEAARLAREIEGSQAENAHMREERGGIHPEDAMDEEEKYSGVRRQGPEYPPLQSSQANRYMPPARRPPTGKPTVAGAPVDPSIVAMQMASVGTSSVDKKSPSKESPKSVQPSATQPEDVPEVGREASQTSSANKAPNDTATKQLAPIKTSKIGESATANVENELLDSFRQFASTEKMRVQDHRRQREQRVTQDKAIKLNDLMKFSQNFKLNTPVPNDLVPILAKDKIKQEELIEKARRNAESGATLAQAPRAASNERSSPKKRVEGRIDSVRAMQESSNSRHAMPPQGPQATQPGRERQQPFHAGQTLTKTGQGLLSHRLADGHRQHKTGVPPMAIPQPLQPIPLQSISRGRAAPSNAPHLPSGQQPSSVRTPTSASSTSGKLNVRAMEFRPNPAAKDFTPPGEPSKTSSPRSTSQVQLASRPTTPSAFFGSKKPLPFADRASISDHFNPLTRLKEKAQQDPRGSADNGGIRPAFTTPPTWNPPTDGEEYRSYKQMFDHIAPVSAQVSPQHGSPSHPSLPHQHQLPAHLQQGSQSIPHMPASQHMQFHSQPPPPHFPNGPHHYDEHRMHLSTSSSTMYPSPRMQNATIAYPSPMHQPAQLAYGQPMPQYFMAPNGPQAPHYGRHFQGGPQMMPAQGAPLAAPMMVQQSSQGGYMGPPHGMALPFNPGMPMYPPGQPAGYNNSSQGSNNFPSPGRSAPMMMHQGSHQGQHSQAFMGPGQPFGQPVYAQQQPPHMMPMRGYGSPQPHYNQSPQPQYHYPHAPSRAPSGSYGVQPPQGPHQHMAAQQAPAAMEGGEEMK